MMPLYIPMHPSSKIPMMACRSRRSRPSSAPRVAATWRAPPHFSGSNGRTWLRSWSMRPSVSHCASARRANASSNASLQTVLYGMPAFVSDPFRFSMPTRPGHWPLQLASVRIGARCRVRPASTWLVYCHTASTTTIGMAGSMVRKAAMPAAWLSRKPWPLAASTAWPRTTPQPRSLNTRVTVASRAAWAGQQTRLADNRESPLATRQIWLNIWQRLPRLAGRR